MIKELPSLIPNSDNNGADSPFPTAESSDVPVEKKNSPQDKKVNVPSSTTGTTATQNSKKETRKENMGKSPGEIAFFKLLHSELKKATTFFERAKQEFTIREARVREGIEIFRKPNMTMVSDKWSIMAKSIYRLYKDLLLLELYAIMTYTSFSKILKKHDKVTGYETRIAFMANVVNKASFVHYPDLLVMIQRAQKLFEEVSHKLMVEGNSALCEDEKLFISMIHRFYGQIMDKAVQEGAPDADIRSIRTFSDSSSSVEVSSSRSISGKSQTPTFKNASSLKSLVEENDATEKNKSNGCLSDDPDDASTSTVQKRSIDTLVNAANNDELGSEGGGSIRKKTKLDPSSCT